MLSRRRFLQIAAASSGLAVTGADLLSQAVANASPAILPNGSRGVRHVVILMMENRSFDHARDRHARNLRDVLLPFAVPARDAVRPSAIPTSSDVISPPSESLLQVLEGTASFDPADICSGDSVQSVSPAPVNHPPRPQTFGGIAGLTGTSGMADLFKSYRSSD